MNDSGGIDYARKKMTTFHNEALDILAGFPDSPSKTALKQLVDYTIERNK